MSNMFNCYVKAFVHIRFYLFFKNYSQGNFALLYHYINSQVDNRERSSLIKPRLVYYGSSPCQTTGFH